MKEPISMIQLAQFRSDPKVHGPRMGVVQLDWTGSTRLSDWNQAVVELLAESAQTTYPSISTKVNWRRLFAARIDRIISDALHFRKTGTSYVETKRKQALRSLLQQVRNDFVPREL